MIIFTLIYPANNKSNEIKIFKPNFVSKNQNKFKIVYKNKLLPLQSKLIIEDNKIDQIKIQLIYYGRDLKIHELIYITESLSDLHINRKFKNNLIRAHKLKFFIFNWIIILYDNFTQENKIKIFGENFVKNNKNKCFIL